MTIGTGTFTPSRFYVFPRSYVYDFVVYQNGDTILETGGFFTIIPPGGDPTRGYFRVNPDWWAWSSKTWQMQNIITECYYKLTSVSPEVPMPFQLHWLVTPLTPAGGLYFGWFGFETDPRAFPLQPAPSSYWLPPPLP
jgi:hypothetical protein